MARSALPSPRHCLSDLTRGGGTEQTAGPSNATPVRKRTRRGEPGDVKDSSPQTEIGKQELKVSCHNFREGAAKGDGLPFWDIPMS